MTVVIEETDDGTKEQLKEELKKEQDKINKDVHNVLEEVWQKIFDMAFLLCPVDTGTLQSTITLVLGDTDFVMSGGIGSYPKAITIFDATIMAGDESVSRPDGYPCIYAQWVHDGHFTASGAWVPPQSFLSDAIAMYEEELWEAIKRVMDELEKGEE